MSDERAGDTIEIGGELVRACDTMISMFFMRMMDETGEARADLNITAWMREGSNVARIRGRLRTYVDDVVWGSEDRKMWFGGDSKYPERDGARRMVTEMMTAIMANRIYSAGPIEEFKIDGPPTRFMDLVTQGKAPSWMNTKKLEPGDPDYEKHKRTSPGEGA